MDVLDEAKKMDSVGVMTNGLAYIDRMCIDSEKQKKSHKIFASQWLQLFKIT